MKKLLAGIFLLFIAHWATAQIVWLDPAFPTVDDDVTIYYDATQGSGGLVGETPVYMHSGVITTSGGAGNWQYVQGTWGTANTSDLMVDEGNNIHSKTINIRNYYGIPMGVEVEELAMVFRNADGSKEGKTVDFQDIFVPIYSSNSSLIIAISSPADDVVLTETGEMININVNTSQDADISITDNGNAVITTSSPTSNLQTDINVTTPGEHEVIATATNGSETVSDTFYYIVNPAINVAEPPAGMKNGINHIDANTVHLQLWAPWKDFVYVIGDFNDWTPDLNYYMNRSSDGATWWIEINGLSPSDEYAFQYYVDGEIKIADPYSTKILDKWNDPYIEASVYPNLKPYPEGMTSGIVSAFQTSPTTFNWQNDNYDKPAVEDLVIYELLIRDFSEEHSFQSVIDSLDYLERLGINAIEFMPVNEFEGNVTWGYNPSFHMALDKYYGTPEAFKTLVDECHSRGIAIIIDVVYNHHFSQSPLAQLYWDSGAFKPAPENPWLNREPQHPFNVGSDMDHEAQATKDWLDQVMVHWIEEYHIDGFRFDLSKGFTQNFSNDVGAWGNYDQSRVDLIKRMADVIWAVDPDFYVTLEHLSVASEEKVLADYGMVLWGNNNHEYNEATMGYTSNLSGVDAKVSWRNFNDPHLKGYMESHDEERLMFKNYEFGNSGPNGYDITDPETAYDRMELAGAFFFTMPGPKMVWQFGELGYDYSINTCEDGTVNPDCRLSPKPIRWDYYQEQGRRDIYDVWRSLIHLKTTYPVFGTTDYNYNLTSKLKRINLNSADMNVAVIGNFDVQPNDAQPLFQHTGWWYEYFSGDSINVTDMNMSINLDAGGYKLYIDQPVANPTVITSDYAPEWLTNFNIFPNPSNGSLALSLELDKAQDVSLSLHDMAGRKVTQLYNGFTSDLYLEENLSSQLAAGIYLLTLRTEQGTWAKKWVVQR